MYYKVLLTNILSLLLAVNAVHLDHLDSTLITHHIKSSDSTYKVGSTVWNIVLNRTYTDECQIRVYFPDFKVGESDQQGQCLGGLYVYGQYNSNNVPIICGENTGQHLYLNFYNDYPIHLVVEQLKYDTTWAISYEFIECSDTVNRAPGECLQYFPERIGTVESFNYRSLQSIPATPITYQLAYQDYYVCIGSSTDTYNSITWTSGDQSNYYFVLTSTFDVIKPGTVGTVVEAQFDFDCILTPLMNDYVEILSGTYSNVYGQQQTSRLFCGAGFPSFVYSTEKPFRLHVVTNGVEIAREGNIGFSLSYVLN